MNVMCRWRYFIGTNQLVLYINAYKVLVSVVLLAFLLEPAGIGVIQMPFVLTQPFGQLTLLDPTVFIPDVALFGSLNNSGVNYLSLPGGNTILTRKGVKLLKYIIYQPGTTQLFPKSHRVLASGMASPRERPRNHMNDKRSRT